MHSEGVGQIVRELVEVVRDSDAPTPCTCQRGKTLPVTLQNEAHRRPTAPRDHDLLACFRPLDQL